MSILIMSIGVASVATLFPMSVKRAIQATQLTNATILRNNAEGIVDAFPELIHDPDRDGNYIEHFQSRAGRRYVIDPLGGFAYQAAGLNTFTGTFGNFKLPADTAMKPVSFPARYAPTFNQELFHSQDSWVTEYEGMADFTTPRQKLILNPDEGFGIEEVLKTVNDFDRFRLVFFGVTQRHGEVWEFNKTELNAVLADGVITLPFTLPDNDEYGARVIVRFQRLERRYSWFLTVRKNARGYANVDVVIAFRRAFLQSDESVYFPSVDLTKGGIPDSKPGDSIDDSVAANEIRGINLLQYFSIFDDIPKVNRGDYLFDVGNVRWYRIQQIEETSTDGVVNIFLETDILESSAAGVMFMPRVVQVFPLGNKPLAGF
ncbi:MAG: hypothetical protein O3A00_01505 [Planctomycetota bacterium]|nr:hypothetical protein [Planctomycetota bacterium]